MTEIKIDWLDSCPACGCSQHTVSTTDGSKDWLYSGDEVKCGECGHAGEIDADGEAAWVNWNEDEAND